MKFKITFLFLILFSQVSLCVPKLTRINTGYEDNVVLIQLVDNETKLEVICSKLIFTWDFPSFANFFEIVRSEERVENNSDGRIFFEERDIQKYWEWNQEKISAFIEKIDTNYRYQILCNGRYVLTFPKEYWPTDGYIIEIKQNELGVCLWNIAKGDIESTFIKNCYNFNAIDVSPDGRYLVTASSKGAISFCDLLKSNEPLLHMEAPQKNFANKITAISVSSNGRYIIVGWNDGDIDFWKLDEGSILES